MFPIAGASSSATIQISQNAQSPFPKPGYAESSTSLSRSLAASVAAVPDGLSSAGIGAGTGSNQGPDDAEGEGDAGLTADEHSQVCLSSVI